MSSEQKIMQCHLCKEHCPQAEMASKIANGRMFATKELIACQKELEAYRAIGTPEECREAVEKQKAKTPIRNDKCTCPSCGTHNEVFKKRRNTVAHDIVYCLHCGQAVEIDRLEE